VITTAAAPLPGSSGSIWLAHRIVEHHQNPPVGEQVAIHLCPLVKAVGYLRARHAERPQEPLEHPHRADRMHGPPVQVGEQLPVSEMPGYAVRGVHGKAALAHSPLACDDHDRRREPRLLVGHMDEALTDVADLIGTAGEIGDTGGEQVRDRLLDGLDSDGLGWQVKGRVAGEDGVLEPLQPSAGLDPQLVDHGPPGVPVNLQRLGRTVAAVQGQHQLAAQPLPQRKLPDQFRQLADQFVMSAQVEFEREPVLIGGDALLIQPARCRLDELAVYAAKRGTPPQPQRIAVARDSPVQVIGVMSRASGGNHLPEPLGVKPPVADLEDVTLCPRGDGRGVAVGGEPAPERGNADLRLGTSGRRQVFAVDRLQQPAHGDHTACI
jgi:hypothetical protein